MYSNLKKAEVKKVTDFIPNGTDHSVKFNYSDEVATRFVYFDEKEHVAYDLQDMTTVYPVVAPNKNNLVSVEAKWMVTKRNMPVVTKLEAVTKEEMTIKIEKAYLQAKILAASIAIEKKLNKRK